MKNHTKTEDNSVSQDSVVEVIVKDTKKIALDFSDETVHIVFGRWRAGQSEHIIGLFHKKEDAEQEAKEALVGEVPRWETWTREFWVR